MFKEFAQFLGCHLVAHITSYQYIFPNSGVLMVCLITNALQCLARKTLIGIDSESLTFRARSISVRKTSGPENLMKVIARCWLRSIVLPIINLL